MFSQDGFYGAVKQYFTIEDKPRLHKRNTWFEDHKPSENTTVIIYSIAFVLAMLILGGWLL